MMILSIIVPIYKVEKYLVKCVESLLDCDSENYEIILVDDGSPDNCPAICDEYMKKSSIIKVIHKQNGGLSDARNAALPQSNGKYVMFVDSDDYIKSGALKKVLFDLQSAEADVIAYGSINVVDDVQTEKHFYNPNCVLDGKSFWVEVQKNSGYQIAVWNCIYRKDFLINNNLYFKKGIYHEDVEWSPRVFDKAQMVSVIDEPYLMHVIREDSITTHKDLSKNIRDIVDTMQSLERYFEKKKDTEYFTLLWDELVNCYLSLYAEGKFGYKKAEDLREINLEKRYLKEPLYFRKTKCKVFLYGLNKKLYCKINEIFHKIGM